MPVLTWVAIAGACVPLLVAVREALAIRIWPRRCAAVLEPGKAGPYHGRCLRRAGHEAEHELDRGMDAVRWRTVLEPVMLEPDGAPLVLATAVDPWYRSPAVEVGGRLEECRRQVRASVEEALGPEPTVSKWSVLPQVRMTFEWPEWWRRG